MSNINYVVKIKTNDDGEKYDNPKWCLVDPCNYQGNASLCSAEFFGLGESGCEYEVKMGKITCTKCVEKIKTYHKIKV